MQYRVAFASGCTDVLFCKDFWGAVIQAHNVVNLVLLSGLKWYPNWLCSVVHTNEISNDTNIFRIKLVLLSGLKLQSKLKTLKLYWAKCYYKITVPNAVMKLLNQVLKLPVWHNSYLNSTCVVPINLESKPESYHGIWWWWSPCGGGKFDLSHRLLTVAVAAGSTGYDADAVEVDDGAAQTRSSAAVSHATKMGQLPAAPTPSPTAGMEEPQSHRWVARKKAERRYCFPEVKQGPIAHPTQVLKLPQAPNATPLKLRRWAMLRPNQPCVFCNW
jgi:hypothetical protein